MASQGNILSPLLGHYNTLWAPYQGGMAMFDFNKELSH